MTIKNSTKILDSLFNALASKHRREIVHLVSLQPMAINKLATERKLSLPAIYKHIKVLEEAGLVIRKKTGQTNYLALKRASLLSLQDWVMQYHAYWGNDKETLENYTKFIDKS